MIIDNALSDFDGFRDECDKYNYEGETSPFDGVFYHDLASVPLNIHEEIVAIISDNMGFEPVITIMFLRMSKKGVYYPHQAHTDLSLGQYSLMLYMNRQEDCQGGTSILEHKETGMTFNPVNEEQKEIWKSDKNDKDSWLVIDGAKMRQNRAFIFNAGLYHRAEPIGGFGDNSKNGRLVLTAFFNEAA